MKTAMRSNPIVGRLLLALGFAFVSASALSDEPPPGHSGKFETRVLVDARIGTERQLAQAREAEREAQNGNHWAQYVLGTLYRLGKRHPAQLFERDDGRAATYLSNAAINGQLYAMAGMAELELRRQHAMDAMVWAQAFTMYQKVVRDEGPLAGHVDNQAYAAYLLQRCYDKVGRGDDVQRQLEDAFAAFQQNHDAKIRAGLGRSAHGSDDSAGLTLAVQNPELRRYNTSGPKQERLKTPGAALFLLGVAADGKVAHRLVIDSLPDEAFAEGLAGLADRFRFNTAAEGSELRWGVVPLNYDNHTYAIRQKPQ